MLILAVRFSRTALQDPQHRTDAGGPANEIETAASQAKGTPPTVMQWFALVLRWAQDERVVVAVELLYRLWAFRLV